MFTFLKELTEYIFKPKPLDKAELKQQASGVKTLSLHSIINAEQEKIVTERRKKQESLAAKDQTPPLNSNELL